MHRSTLRTVLAAGLAAAGAFAIAGPLNPPAGPVAPTFKTLAEVEPRIPINAAHTPGDADSLFKITQPGSYYLTGDIAGVPDKHGIEIASGGVTLDLNGFSVVGAPGAIADRGGLVSTASAVGVTVRNGQFRGWTGHAVRLTSINNCVAEDLVAADSGHGAWFGAHSVISRVAAFGNQGLGIMTGSASTITWCSSGHNDGGGFEITSHSTAAHCTANNNVAEGFWLSNGCSVTACTADNNGNDGFEAIGQATVRDSTAYNNGFDGTGAGFRGGFGCRLEGNHAVANRVGFVLLSDAIAVRNSASGNTTNYQSTATGAAAIVNAAAGFSSTNAWANLSK